MSGLCLESELYVFKSNAHVLREDGKVLGNYMCILISGKNLLLRCKD